MPIVEQGGLDLVHAINADTVSEFNQRGGIENRAALKVLKAAKALPVCIFVQLFNRPFIRAIVVMFEQLKSYHQANGLALTTEGAVIKPQCFV